MKWILAAACVLSITSSALAGNGAVRKAPQPVRDLYLVQFADHVPAAQARRLCGPPHTKKAAPFLELPFASLGSRSYRQWRLPRQPRWPR